MNPGSQLSTVHKIYSAHSLSLEAAADRYIRDGWPTATLVTDGSGWRYEHAETGSESAPPLPASAPRLRCDCGHLAQAHDEHGCQAECDDDATFRCSCERASL